MVVNVVGPYSYYGEKVLRPCIRAGTAWVDLNGETPWYGYILSMREKIFGREYMMVEENFANERSYDIGTRT